MSGPSTVTNAPPARVSRLALAIAAVAVVAFALLLGWTALNRSPFYDELYTWHVTRHERSFADSLHQSWLRDNHPPLFYMLAWLDRMVAGSIEQARLINVAILALGAGGAWAVIRHSPQLWLPAAAATLVLIAAPGTMAAGTELRSYFLSSVATFLLGLTLTAGWTERRFDQPAIRVVMAGALLIGFNTHILTSLITGAMLLPFVVAAIWSNDRAALRRMLVPALLFGALFLATCLVQIPTWAANTRTFWIPAGFDAARWAIERALTATLLSNPAVLAGALIGSLLLARQVLRDRRLTPAAATAGLLGAGLILAIVLLLALHAYRPVVLARYLAPLFAPLALAMALCVAELARRGPRWLMQAGLAAALVITMLAAYGNARQTARSAGWLGAAALAARVQQACPAAAVHIDPAYWNAYTMALPPADNAEVLPASYALIARRLDLTLEAPSSRRMGGACPTLFWAEHDTETGRTAASILTRLRAVGYPVERIWLYRVHIGWVASDRSLSSDLLR